MTTCEDCIWYDAGECICTMDGEARHPQTMACGQYESEED